MSRPPFAVSPAERARDALGDSFVGRAQAGGGADPRNLDPKAMPVVQLHLRINERERVLIQMCADMEESSKQRFMRRALREYCERKLRAAGVPFPGRTAP